MNTGYYVTVKRGKRTGWLFGPIACPALARSFVAYVRRVACRLDPWCDFDAFGVSSLTTKATLPPGTLNNRLFHT